MLTINGHQLVIGNQDGVLVDPKKNEEEAKMEGTRSFFAGDLNLTGSQNLADQQKKDFGDIRADAQKKAMKQIMNQFESDDQTTNAVRDLQSQITDAKSQADTALQAMNENGDPDGVYQKTIDEANATIAGASAGIRGIRLEEPKNQGMINAQNQADKIMSDATDEVMGDIMGTYMEKVDDAMEKMQDKLDEKQQEQEDAEKASQSQADSQTDSTTESQIDSAVQAVQKFIQQENVLPEDALGILVDQQS